MHLQHRRLQPALQRQLDVGREIYEPAQHMKLQEVMDIAQLPGQLQSASSTIAPVVGCMHEISTQLLWRSIHQPLQQSRDQLEHARLSSPTGATAMPMRAPQTDLPSLVDV